MRRHFRPDPARPSETKSSLAAILQTPAIATDPVGEQPCPTAPVGVHILGQDAHLELALWTLRTFYHFARVRYPLTVHLQGQNTSRMHSTFGHYFPQARLITQTAADTFVEPLLRARGLQRLLTMRRKLFLMMKLIDVALLARTPLVLFFDTDVLFFRRPHELLLIPDDFSAAPHLFLRDAYPSYCITTSQAQADLGINLVMFANAGVMRLVTAGIDLAACERFMAHPALAQEHWHLEQTLHALNASAQSRLQLLPAPYAMLDGLLTRPGLIARHYISPIRSLHAEEGIAYLMKTGFLETAADPGSAP